jgi:hypothetical protein
MRCKRLAETVIPRCFLYDSLIRCLLAAARSLGRSGTDGARYNGAGLRNCWLTGVAVAGALRSENATILGWGADVDAGIPRCRSTCWLSQMQVRVHMAGRCGPIREWQVARGTGAGAGAGEVSTFRWAYHVCKDLSYKVRSGYAGNETPQRDMILLSQWLTPTVRAPCSRDRARALAVVRAITCWPSSPAVGKRHPNNGSPI